MEELTAKAEEFVRAKGFNGLADHTLVKNWMAEFVIEHARDAVQDLRDESDMYFEQLKAERAKVAELEKQSAALVEALEEMIKHADQCDGVTNIQSFKNRIVWITRLGNDALEAHKKGGNDVTGR